MIKLTNISKKHGKNKILDNINLTFDDTGLISILGKTGAGKTTLLKILGLLDGFNQGEVVIFNKKLKKFNERRFAKIREENIGIIFQDTLLYESMTVMENLKNGLNYKKENEHEINDKVIVTLDTIGMKQFRHTKVSSLSGGQRQRVSIARGLLSGSKVIIADEPTANLDISNAIEIMRILRRIANEKLVIIVSHDLQLVEQFSNRVIKIFDGKIISDEYNEIKNIDVLYDEYINLDKLSKIKTRHYEISKDELSNGLNLDIVIKKNKIFLKNSNHSQKIILLNEGIESKIIQKNKQIDVVQYETIVPLKTNKNYFKKIINNWSKIKFSKIFFAISLIAVFFVSYITMVISNLYQNNEIIGVPSNVFTVGIDDTYPTKTDEIYKLPDAMFDELTSKISNESYLTTSFDGREENVVAESPVFGYSFVLGKYYFVPSTLLTNMKVILGKSSINPYKEIAISTAFLKEHKRILNTISADKEILGIKLSIGLYKYEIASVFESDVKYFVGCEYSLEEKLQNTRTKYMFNSEYYKNYFDVDVKVGGIALNKFASQFFGIDFELGKKVPFLKTELYITELLDIDNDSIVCFISKEDYFKKVNEIGQQSYTIFSFNENDIKVLNSYGQAKELKKDLIEQKKNIDDRLIITLLMVLVLIMVLIIPMFLYLHSIEYMSYKSNIILSRLLGTTRINIVIAIITKNIFLNVIAYLVGGSLSFFMMYFISPMIEYPFIYMRLIPMSLPVFLSIATFLCIDVIILTVIMFFKTKKTPAKMIL